MWVAGAAEGESAGGARWGPLGYSGTGGRLGTGTGAGAGAAVRGAVADGCSLELVVCWGPPEAVLVMTPDLWKPEQEEEEEEEETEGGLGSPR